VSAVWLVIGAVVIIAVVAMFGPRLASLYARTQVEGRCAALQQEYNALVASGGNAVRAAELQQQLRACNQELQRYGGDVSLASVTLRNCDSQYDAIEAQWVHYKNTDYADILKRGNTFGSMLSMGERLVGCYQQTIAEAEAEGPTLGDTRLLAVYQEIRDSLIRSLAASEARVRCYRGGVAGCDRYFGSTEMDGQSKGLLEEQRTRDPLRAVLGDLDARINVLVAKQAAAAAADVARQRAEQDARTRAQAAANVSAALSANTSGMLLSGGFVPFQPN
jgi:hypothetical protein